MRSQLPLPFASPISQSRESFIVAPCNEAAFRFVERWPDWPTASVGFYGPAGCGKSHLANVWANASGATHVSAALLAKDDAAREAIAALPAEAALVIDQMDLENISPMRDYDSALLSILDRKTGGAIFLGRNQPKEWPAATGDLKSRFVALLNFAMWAPDDELLSRVARKLFADRQLEVKDAVIRQMVGRLERTPAAIESFVTMLDERALAERRPVNERLVAELLDLGTPK